MTAGAQILGKITDLAAVALEAVCQGEHEVFSTPRELGRHLDHNSPPDAL
jgi:hypothetical protein